MDSTRAFLNRTWTGAALPPEVRDLHRRASNYSSPHLFPAEARFTASDALSLGALVRDAADEPSAQGDHYRRSWEAVTRALGLRAPERLLVDPFEPAAAEPPARALLQVLRLRRGVIGFQDEWGSMLEGDLWGLRGGRGGRAPLDPAQHAAVSDAQRWYHETADRLLADLDRLDRVACVLLGWEPPGAWVSYADLRAKHGYPDVARASDELFCP